MLTLNRGHEPWSHGSCGPSSLETCKEAHVHVLTTCRVLWECKRAAVQGGGCKAMSGSAGVWKETRGTQLVRLESTCPSRAAGLLCAGRRGGRFYCTSTVPPFVLLECCALCLLPSSKNTFSSRQPFPAPAHFSFWAGRCSGAIYRESKTLGF